MKNGNLYNQSKRWKLQSPNGDILIIKNLNKFCKDNKLSNSAMSAVSQGLNKQHKGWQCKKL